MKSKLSSEKRAEIFAALKDHPNGRDIARQVGCSDTVVRKIAKSVGIELTAGKAKRGWLSPETHARIFAELKANPNARAVARKVGGRIATVGMIAKREGIKLTAGKAARAAILCPKIPPEKRTEIIAALKANPNTRAVARQLGGVSQRMVWKIAKQAGIELTAGKAAMAAILCPKIPPEKRTEIIAALKANPNTKAVVRQLGGVCQRTVWRIAKQTGIELTKRGGWRTKQTATPAQKPHAPQP